MHIVLIETQWNVKKDVVDAMQKTRQVLIETQWNVKWLIEDLKKLEVVVLIETQWNVKYKETSVNNQKFSY